MRLSILIRRTTVILLRARSLAKGLDGELWNLYRVANAGLADLDDLSGDRLRERIVSLFQIQRVQGLLIGRHQAFDILRPQRSVLQQLVNRHRPFPPTRGSKPCSRHGPQVVRILGIRKYRDRASDSRTRSPATAFRCHMPDTSWAGRTVRAAAPVYPSRTLSAAFPEMASQPANQPERHACLSIDAWCWPAIPVAAVAPATCWCRASAGDPRLRNRCSDICDPASPLRAWASWACGSSGRSGALRWSWCTGTGHFWRRCPLSYSPQTPIVNT